MKRSDTRIESPYSPFAIRHSLMMALPCALAATQAARPPRRSGPILSSTPRRWCRGSIVDMRYAGAHNFVGRPIDGYQAPHCLLTREAAAALADVARDLAPRGLVIKVFDCYRPVRAVMNFVRWARDLNDHAAKAEFYPNVDKRTLFRDGYIASHSGHSRGSTIDLTLARADGRELDMGTPFDFFSPRSWAAATEIERRQSTPTACCSRSDAPAWLSPLREGMVALHAGARAVSRHLFRFSGKVRQGGQRASASIVVPVLLVPILSSAGSFECLGESGRRKPP